MTRATHAATGLAIGFTLASMQQLQFMDGVVLALVVEAAALLPDIDFTLGLKHRGITHSLLMLSIVLFLSAQVGSVLILPVALGYGSHLLLDSMTVRGIPLLYPLKFRFRVLKLRTGGRMDGLIGALTSCLAVWAFILTTQA